MKLAIIGSRGFSDYEMLKEEIKYEFGDEPEEIISGGAKGADTLGAIYAKEYNLKLTVFKPDWTIGKHAGFIRNTQIIEAADVIIAFWDGESKGTLDSINKAKKLDKQVVVINY